MFSLKNLFRQKKKFLDKKFFRLKKFVNKIFFRINENF